MIDDQTEEVLVHTRDDKLSCAKRVFVRAVIRAMEEDN